jgi:thiol-disulfide isomerase/thioredoxin
MVRLTSAFLALLAVTAAGRAEDKKTPPTPAEQFKALVQEYQTAQTVFYKAYKAAKSEAEADKIFKEKYPRPEKYAARFLELARKNPKANFAVDALTWVINNDFGSSRDKGSPWNQALNLLRNDYLKSDQLGAALPILSLTTDKTSEIFLRQVLKKNPHRPVQGQACMTLARYLRRLATWVRQVKEHPEATKQYVKVLGKERVQELRGHDADQLNKESERLLERVIDQYADVKSHRRGTLGEAAKNQLFEIRHLIVGKVAPEITGKDQDGKRFKLSAYRGKVVVLVFWGSWCGPCMGLVPHERALVKRLADKPFALLGINSDETREDLKKVMAKEKIRWRSWWDGGSPEGPIATRWNVHAWPTTYVLDAKGVIRYKNVLQSELDKAVDTLLKEVKPKK